MHHVDVGAAAPRNTAKLISIDFRLIITQSASLSINNAVGLVGSPFRFYNDLLIIEVALTVSDTAEYDLITVNA